MKNIIAIIVMLVSVNSYAYQLRYTDTGSIVKWDAGEISIYLDPSLEEVNYNAYHIVEESFLKWVDYIDIDITLNFVHESCEPWTVNCVLYAPQDNVCHEGSEGCAYGEWYVETGYITNFNIMFNEVDSDSFESVALHEIGHFFGFMHSENSNAVMYYLNKNTVELHQDDINGVKTLYSTDGTVYESIEENVPEVFSACSITHVGNSVFGTIWQLLF